MENFTRETFEENPLLFFFIIIISLSNREFETAAGLHKIWSSRKTESTVTTVSSLKIFRVNGRSPT